MASELQDNLGRGELPSAWPRIHPEGRKFGLAVLGAALLCAWFAWETIAWPLAALAVGVFAFFRDPERIVPQDDRFIVSPADGRIVQIEQIRPPRELIVEDGSGVDGLPDQALTRVSIHLSLFDVHINRTPIAGTIRRVVYVPGKLLNADLDKASDENERQHFLIERSDGTRVAMTQIAGLIARRIVAFAKTGDTMGVGQRLGMIRFGSRVDVYLPKDTGSYVIIGQKVVAGETVIGAIGSRPLLEGVAQ